MSQQTSPWMAVSPLLDFSVSESGEMWIIDWEATGEIFGRCLMERVLPTWYL